MGVVYKAHDLKLPRDVALKVVQEELAESSSKDWILQEAHAACQLEHPNIATVYEVFEDDGRTYLAMQLLEGGTLGDRLRESPMPIVDAVRIALAIARALEEAHGSDILHRDVKPQNVMFTKHGEVKLTDFGLAKESDKDATQTLTGVVRGTAAYLPPELLKGGKWDAQGDVYSAGVVFYEMLAGRHPFLAGNYNQLLQAVLHEEPPSIASLRPEVPQRLEEIAVRALEKRPRDRYRSASALAEDLDEVLQLLEAQSDLPRGARILSRRARRRRTWIATGLVGVLSVATLVAIQRLALEDAVGPPAIAVLPLPSRIGGEDLEGRAQLLAEMLTTDLGESSHIRVVGRTQLQTILANHRLQFPSEVTADQLRGVADSADLSHIVTVTLIGSGSRLRADIEILEIPGCDTVATASEEVASTAGIHAMIDPLAARTRAAILSREQLASERDRRFGDITSESAEAVELFHQALKFEDESPVRAVELYDEAIDLDPDFYLARVYRDIILLGNEGFDAIADVDALSDYERLLYEIGHALVQGDMQELLLVADRMLALRPGDANGVNAKYISQYFSGAYQEAVETCEWAVRRGYRTYIDHLLLNSSYAMSGMSPTEMIERYTTLLEEDPSDAYLKYWLAVTCLTVGEDERAHELLSSVFDVYPKNVRLMKVLVDAYTWREGPSKSSDYAQARAYLDRIVDLNRQADPGSDDWLQSGVPVSFRLGELLRRQESIDEAIDAYEQSVETAPDHYNSFLRLGVAYDQKGETKKAIANLDRYIGATELNMYDATAQGREDSCAANPVCHSISRPAALADAEQRLARLRSEAGAAPAQ